MTVAELVYVLQMVIAVPEVRHLRLEDGDEFLILACDGIWDVLSNQEVRLPLKCSTGSGGFLTSSPTPHWLPSSNKISYRGYCFSSKAKVVDVRLSCAAQAVDFVRKRLARRMTPQAICEAMCDHCLAPDTQACLSPVPCPLSLSPGLDLPDSSKHGEGRST